MWNFSVLIILFLKICSATASCPLACNCREVAHDSSRGQSIECNSHFKRSLPNQEELNSETTFELHFRYNSLQEFPNRLKNFTQLRILDLSKNRLFKLNNNTFQFLGNLKEVNLSGNYLTLIGVSAFRGLHRLQSLDLSGNELHVVPSDILQFWPETNAEHRQVCLGRNRWVCDCSLKGFIEWYINYVINGSIETCEGNPLAECMSPPSLSKRRFDVSTLGGVGMCEAKPTTYYQKMEATTQSSYISTSSLYWGDHETTSVSESMRTVNSQGPSNKQFKDTLVGSSYTVSSISTTSDNTKFWVVEGEFVMYGALVAIFVIFLLLLVFAAVLCRMAQRQKVLETVATSDARIKKMTIEDETVKFFPNQGEPSLSIQVLNNDQRISGDYAEIPLFSKIKCTAGGFSDKPRIDVKPLALGNRSGEMYTWEIKAPGTPLGRQDSPPDVKSQKSSDSPPSREIFCKDLQDNAYQSIPVQNSEYQSRIYDFRTEAVN